MQIMQMLANINWLYLIIGVVAAFALSFVWYSVLFGKTWARLAEIDKMEDCGPGEMVLPIIGETVGILAMGIFVHLLLMAGGHQLLIVFIIAMALGMLAGTLWKMQNPLLWLIEAGSETGKVIILALAYCIPHLVA